MHDQAVLRLNPISWRLWQPIAIAGVVAGSVDVAAACVMYKVSPYIILQAIAGGLLGRETFSRGWSTAALGLGLQWAMSIVIAACCVTTSYRLEVLRRRWILAGFLYGAVTFAVMDGIVVPMSASSTKPQVSLPWLIENLLAMWLFGLIITGLSVRALQKARE